MPLSGVFQACECAAARMAALRDFGKAPSRCTRRKSFHGQPGAVEIRRNFESPESLAGTIQFGKGARASRPQLSASGRKHSDARKNTNFGETFALSGPAPKAFGAEATVTVALPIFNRIVPAWRPGVRTHWGDEDLVLPEERGVYSASTFQLLSFGEASRPR